MGIILYQLLKYFVHWKRFFHLVNKFFKTVFYDGQQQRIFYFVGTVFFHSYFLKPLLQLEGGPFYKTIISAGGNRFLQIFHTLNWMEAVFCSGEKDLFWRNPSFWLANMEFRLIKNLVLLFRNFSASEHHSWN